MILPLDSKPGKRSGSNPSKVQKTSHRGVKEVKGVTGETVAIRQAPDLDDTKEKLKVQS